MIVSGGVDWLRPNDHLTVPRSDRFETLTHFILAAVAHANFIAVLFTLDECIFSSKVVRSTAMALPLADAFKSFPKKKKTQK